MKNGPYILVVSPPEYPGKRYRGRYCYEHHLVWWQATGKVVATGEVVHHKNNNKHDNRIENLEVMSPSEHAVHHGKDNEAIYLDFPCFYCEKLFRIDERNFRFRLLKAHQQYFYCSRRCSVSAQSMIRKGTEWEMDKRLMRLLSQDSTL